MSYPASVCEFRLESETKYPVMVLLIKGCKIYGSEPMTYDAKGDTCLEFGFELQ